MAGERQEAGLREAVLFNSEITAALITKIEEMAGGDG